MSCAAPSQRYYGSLRISGTVTRSGRPVRGYVRLLDDAGEFVAELPTDKEGTFTFFAAPGAWTLRLLTSEGTTDVPVVLGDEDAPHVALTL
jgi:hypothetical protein